MTELFRKITVGVSEGNLWRNPFDNSFKKSLEEILEVPFKEFLGKIKNISWRNILRKFLEKVL